MTAARRLLAALILTGVASARAVASVEIHPAGDTVPENLLRIELRFERPQRLPFDMQRLKLLDDAGVALENALLDLTLASADGRRITVLMDPGRVKSGVGPNVDAGRALHAGRSVRLQVEADAIDATDVIDVTGGSIVVKEWRVTPAVSTRMRPGEWQLTMPRAGSCDALVVAFHDAISSSGEALLAVTDATGYRLGGTTSLEQGDAVWRFMPSRRWAAGAHRLVAHPELEDPSGNRRCSAFEELGQSSVRCEATRLDLEIARVTAPAHGTRNTACPPTPRRAGSSASSGRTR
jgi:hypothetical protein